MFALAVGTGPEGSMRPVGAQFGPIRSSTGEKHLPLRAVDVGIAQLLLNMPRMPPVGLVNTVRVCVSVSQPSDMSY